MKKLHYVDNQRIFVVDDLGVEPTAMLQALYSRDPQSVTEHIEQVRRVGYQKFMAQYYVGYGHKSIGDCGTTTLFIEQVSLLAAKAIQQWALYNGQEASTRYLNMSGQTLVDPTASDGTEEVEGKGAEIQRIWMELYQEALQVLVPHLTKCFPIQAEDKVGVYEKAIKAKAFDIARGFLPAGLTTLLSWHTNLRQAHDHLLCLRHHPALEVRQLAGKIHGALKEKYPSSFVHKEHLEQEEYLEATQMALAYSEMDSIPEFECHSSLDRVGLARYRDLILKRPAKSELPHQLRRYGNLHFTFPMDFGTFRDLQRHRAGVIMMPLLTTNHGFYPWYITQLPEGFQQKALRIIEEQKERLVQVETDPVSKQYLIAIGYTVPCEITFSLPGAVYLAELRSGQTVHPIFRPIAQKIGLTIEEIIPGIALHCDNSPDAWSTRRGTQDIVKKTQLSE